MKTKYFADKLVKDDNHNNFFSGLGQEGEDAAGQGGAGVSGCSSPSCSSSSAVPHPLLSLASFTQRNLMPTSAFRWPLLLTYLPPKVFRAVANNLEYLNFAINFYVFCLCRYECDFDSVLFPEMNLLFLL